MCRCCGRTQLRGGLPPTGAGVGPESGHGWFTSEVPREHCERVWSRRESADEAFTLNMHPAAALVGSERVEAQCPSPEERAEPRSFEYVRASYGSRVHRAVRMSEPCFAKLVDVLHPHLPSSPHSLSPALPVLVALRYYAGASFLDVCALAGLSTSTFYNAVWELTEAVLSTPELQMIMPV